MNETTPITTRKKRLSIAKVMIGLVILMLVGGLAVTGYLYYQTRQELRMLTTEVGQEEFARREREAVEGKLKKLTFLPQEEPVIATIIDPVFLASQSAFYKDAIEGDKLVVYPEAQKAFIYSPERHIIVNAGPLIVEPQQGLEQETQASAEPAAPRMTVEIRNGSERAGAATQVSQSVNKELYQVLQVSEAVRKDYQETLVVSTDPSLTPDQVTALAREVGGRVVSELPADEVPSSAQVLVIIGAN